MATDVVKQIRRRTRRKFPPMRRSGSSWRDFGVRSRSPSCVDNKAFSHRSITNGRKPFWMPARMGLTRDTQRDATSQEVRRLKEENDALKRAVAETVLDNQRLKKSLGL